MRRSIRERNILFLCHDNACLSQIAEAMAKHLSPPKIRIFSAGVKPTKIPPQVYKVMQELGISLSGQSPKSIDQVPLDQIDLVVSFDEADKDCDILPKKAKVKRWSVPEAATTQNGGTSLPLLRLERDEIDKQVSALFLDYWRNVV
ncbi:MAG TPA: arsenate reductase ArsC [Candidatus Binatia bacterium]|jgi:arsenate reductase